jgi:hypothetical protein
MAFNWLIVAAVFAGVFGVMGLFGGSPGSLSLVIFCAAIFAWILLRRRKLTKFVEAAIVKLKSEPQTEVAPVADA